MRYIFVMGGVVSGLGKGVGVGIDWIIIKIVWF